MSKLQLTLKCRLAFVTTAVAMRHCLHAAICLTVLSPTPAPAATYHLTDLESILGDGFFPTGINDSGHIVGTVIGDPRALLYANGSVTDLGAPTGGCCSIPRAINNVGQIVVDSFVPVVDWPSPLNHAFLYSNGSFSDLGALGVGAYNTSFATGINDLGQVTGYSTVSDPTGQFRPFLYSGGVMTNLGTLGGITDSQAHGINNGGQVVGYSYDNRDTKYEAFVYSGGPLQLVGADSRLSKAADINDSGQIVGTFGVGGADSSAFLFSNGDFMDLGVLDADGSGADAINESGLVVGWLGYLGAGRRAFLYRDGMMMKLDSLLDATGAGWVLNGAVDINGSGWIIGMGTGPNGASAYLLTPVPEPSAFALTALALIAISRQRQAVRNCALWQFIGSPR